MNNEKNKNILLGILMVFILGYVYYNFYLTQQISKIDDAKSRILQAQKKIDELTFAKDTIDEEIEVIQKNVKDINKRIPDKFDKKEIIEYFYYKILNHNLDSNNITFAEPDSRTGKYKTITISLNVIGSKNDIMNFIEDVETSKRKFVIRQLTAKPQNEGKWGSNLSIETYSIN